MLKESEKENETELSDEDDYESDDDDEHDVQFNCLGGNGRTNNHVTFSSLEEITRFVFFIFFHCNFCVC